MSVCMLHGQNTLVVSKTQHFMSFKIVYLSVKCMYQLRYVCVYSQSATDKVDMLVMLS